MMIGERLRSISTQIAQKLNKVTIPPGHRLGRPWEGAWR